MSSALLFVLILLPVVFSAFPKNATEIIKSYGYETEEHWALTPDGYYLLMNRIKTKAKPKGAVLFQHGLTDCSVGVCLSPQSEGLPWFLVDLGYEMWLGNNRGNGYSMRHVKYTPLDAEFWDFSWDEMAQFDLPTQIDYALTTSGFSKLTYIGHSEGTIQAFSGFIINNQLADKVNLYIALAPVAYVAHLRSLVLIYLAAVDLDKIFTILGIHEFSLPAFIEQFLPNICSLNPRICLFELEAIMGPTTHLNDTRLPYIIHYEPNPTSVKNMAHWSQGVRTRKFEKFDYGPSENQLRYNSTSPPQYKLSDFPASLPLALFTGTNDYLADNTDVDRLIAELPQAPLVYETDYGHLDFIMAIDAKKKIFNTIAQLVQKFSA